MPLDHLITEMIAINLKGQRKSELMADEPAVLWLNEEEQVKPTHHAQGHDCCH